MDGGQDGVGILSSASVVDIDVRNNVVAAGRPVVLLVAKDLWCNSGAVAAGLANSSCERNTLYKSTVLRGGGEEGVSIHLFPQVKTTLVPMDD